MTTESQTKSSEDVANTSQEVVKTESVEKPKRTRQKRKTATAETKSEPVRENSETDSAPVPSENNQSDAVQNQEPSNGPDTTAKVVPADVMEFEAHGPMSVDRHLTAAEEDGEYNSSEMPAEEAEDTQNANSSELKSNEDVNSIQNSTDQENNEHSHTAGNTDQQTGAKTEDVGTGQERGSDDDRLCVKPDNEESHPNKQHKQHIAGGHKTTGDSRAANLSRGFLRYLLDLRFAIVYLFLLILFLQNGTITVDIPREFVAKLIGIYPTNHGPEVNSTYQATVPETTPNLSRELPSSPIMFDEETVNNSTHSIVTSTANQFSLPTATISENGQLVAVQLTNAEQQNSGNGSMEGTGSSNTEIVPEQSISTQKSEIEAVSTVESDSPSVSGSPFATYTSMAEAMELLTEKFGERKSFNENDIDAFLEITGQEFADLSLEEETSNSNFSNGNEIVLHFVEVFNRIANQLNRQYGPDFETENSESSNSNSAFLRKSWNIIDGTNLAGISHDGQTATLKMEEHYMNVSKGDAVPNAGLVVEISENGEFWEVRTSTGSVFRTKLSE